MVEKVDTPSLTNRPLGGIIRLLMVTHAYTYIGKKGHTVELQS